MTENFGLTSELVTEERDVPCCVRHEDAGGACTRQAVQYVYELAFCEAHGEEAKCGALMEAGEDATNFFECFRASHVPPRAPAIEHGIGLALECVHSEHPGDEEYMQALVDAYAPDIPEQVRERIRAWILDEQPGMGL